MKVVIKQRVEMIRKGVVPEGYKQTKVGIIPQEWEVKKLRDFLKIKHGKSQKSVEAASGKYPIFGTSGEIGRSLEYLWDKPSVLIGRKGTIDKPQYYDKPFWTIDTLFYSDINFEKALPKYLFYRFNTIDWKKYNEASGVPSLSASTISNIIVSHPPLPEQTTISQILSTADKAIETTETLITLKQQKKKWLMQNLLTGKVRLPEYDNCPVPFQERIRMINDGMVPEGYKQTKVGIIPVEWELEAIKNVSEIINGGTPSTINPEYWGDEILWCTPTDITNCKTKYLFKTERGISKKGLKNSSATLVPKGSLLLCSRATIGEVRIASNEISTNQGFKSLVCKKDCYNEFLYYLISSSHVKKQLKQKAIGSTFLEISKKDISKFLIVFPSLQEQTAIANVLSTADKEIDLLNQRLETLKQQKKALMQLLLTGIVRTTGLNLSSDAEEEGVAYVQ